jgi:hypothetical protein
MKLSATFCVTAFALLAVLPPRAFAQTPRGRVFILMVWDGLRPDFVTQRDTPNLFLMAREGVRFERHHSLYPTLTVVNATAMATGGNPGTDGIEGNVMDFAPLLGQRSATAAQGNSPELVQAKSGPANLENSKMIAALNGSDAFVGRLLSLDTVAQEVEREGGYAAVLGKRGPAAIWDNRVASITDGKDSLGQPNADYLFASDDMVRPDEVAQKLRAAMTELPEHAFPVTARDAFFTKLAIELAIPAAKTASEQGKPALIVLWLHDPDATQHHAGLGTAAAAQALASCDANLGKVREAIAAAGIGARTDLMVVSDHGFATIRVVVNLAEMLVTNGIKKSADSAELTIAQNGGTDLVYLSEAGFPTNEAKRAALQKIVNFAEAQEWCGPIFSKELKQVPEPSAKGRRRRKPPPNYAGWIDGTFAEATGGLMNSARGPDLVISFREIPDADNKSLTGPENPAFTIGADGQQSTKNLSSPLLHPVRGVMYGDVSSKGGFTTGMGMHGAAGQREIHNFCAATGVDFRKRWVDLWPTGNSDVGPTITEALGLRMNTGPNGAYPTGRTMSEALVGGERPNGARSLTATTRLELQGSAVVTTLKFAGVGDRVYLDDAKVEHVPLGRSP